MNLRKRKESILKSLTIIIKSNKYLDSEVSLFKYISGKLTFIPVFKIIHSI